MSNPRRVQPPGGDHLQAVHPSEHFRAHRGALP